MSVRARIVEITPEIAERLIEAHNQHNRAVRSGVVQRYAEDIRAGRWQLNGEAIKVANDGTVLDGQHRLMGVLEANAPIQTVLVTGLARSAQESMDQGIPRGFHDVLRLRGEGDPFSLAAAVKMVAHFQRDGIPFAPGFAPSISLQLASATLERNPEIRDSLPCGRMFKPWMPVSNMTALHFLMASVDAADADAFFNALAGRAPSGILTPVREHLQAEHQRSDGRREHIKVRTVYVCMAWNAWREQTPLPALEWTTRDRFPGIAGLSAPESAFSAV
ncbi:MAG: hypothetical protein KGL39_42255 [Patescibacteria group bacterium]|nr:hypothetical protein [Patescibacteria group bacterium]